MKTYFIRIIPRMVAWILVLLGVGWFVHVSPKTPLEFLEAGFRDGHATQRRRMKNFRTIDATAADEFHKYEELFVCGEQMMRIALIYNITNNPTQVQEGRSFIISGGYYPSKRTEEYLKANNAEYRALVNQLEELRSEIKTNKVLKSSLRDFNKAAKSNGTDFFQIELDRPLLRHFQSQIFWRKES